MAELQWVDSIKAAIKERLMDALPAQAAAVDAERSVSADDATPSSIEYWTSDKEMPPSLPACELVCTNTAREQQDDTVGPWVHTFTAVFTIAGTDEEVLDAQIGRLMLAAILVLDGWPFAKGSVQRVTNADLVRIGNVTYDLVQPGDADGRPFIRTGLVELTCKQYLPVF